MDIVKRLSRMDLTLPKTAPAAANYKSFMIQGHHLYIAGQIPFLNGERMHIGRVGDNLTIAQGSSAARACALNILAQVREAVEGDWDRVKQCLKLGGFVNCIPDFTDHSLVINGASDLMVEVLGEQGHHTRFAVGAASLPFGVAVEIEALFALKTRD